MRLISSLTTLSLISRGVILISSIITIGINAKLLTNTTWANDLLIYTIVISSLSVLACLVPPRPNFLYDAFWALATALCPGFALSIQFTDSPCYGFRPADQSKVSCATYKAGTAFVFLMALGWGCSAFLGLLQIMGVVFNVGKNARQSVAVESNQEPMQVPPKGEGEVRKKNESAVQPVEKQKQVSEKKQRSKINIIYAIPAFATYLLNKIPVPPLQLSLMAPTNNSIQFSAFTEIRVPEGLKIQLDSTHVEVFRPRPDTDDQVPPALARVELPKQRFKGKQRVTFTNQTMQLGDVDEFARLIEDAAYNPMMRVAMRAKTKARMAGLKSSLDIVKEVAFPGFNNFQALQVRNFSIGERDEQGNNIYVELVIANPTPASMTLGDVTLSILAANNIIGSATTSINNLTPGSNSLRIRAALNGTALERDIGDIVKEQIPYLREGNIKLTASGQSVVYEDQHLEYWERAFQAIRISVTKPVWELVEMALSSLNGNEEDGGRGLEIPGVGQGGRRAVEGLVDRILGDASNVREDQEDGFAEELGVKVLGLLGALGIV
ncbi:uncharacterized protein DSM5745_05126 [Aspergillus mulundensis]|uniref:MARVEL domain-containing protein n=1 Tax=Aspergillus mulundensis TaxID=1810919 RepID=A0A3D8S5K1_9EURO|nr:hypothetical protein DSM5745_05126 [Aspergillus mulundensis]RDW81569.1 hypothetical protein DSM5745_05126 [Aspergillus mulundensis]